VELLHTSSSTLDQSFDPVPANSNPFLGLGLDNSGAQTFTVGITGILTEVDVYLVRNGPILSDLHLDIRPTINGVPTADDSAALGSVTVPVPALGITPKFVNFDVSSLGIHVFQSDVLAIVLSGNAQWWGNFGNLYARGAAFGRTPPNDFLPVLGCPTVFCTGGSPEPIDVNFRTFVESTPAAVPEPGTLALMSSAVFTTICCVKTRRRPKRQDNRQPRKIFA
jgi:hypothetical protein